MATKITTGLITDNAITDAKLSDTITATTQSASDNSTSVATTAYVTTAIANLADSAPSTLNTLNELAAALGADANFSTTVTNSIATKLPLAGGTMTCHILLNNAIELRSKDTSSNIKTITRINSSNELEYGWSGSGPVKFMGGGAYTERMRIHTDGNIGIGTTSPAQKLDVNGYIKATRIGAGISPIVPCEVLSTGSTSTALRVLKSGSDDSTQNNLFSVTEISGHGRLSIHDTSQNEDIRFDSNGDSYFNGGDVGIGTTSPSGKLHVSGHTSSIASIFESNGNGDTVPVQLKVKANNGTTSTQGLYGNAGSPSADNSITLGNSGTSGVCVLSSGKAIIGDTASHVDDLLQIETPASGGGHGIQIRRNDSNGDQGIGRIMFGNNNDTDLATVSAITDGQADSARLVFSTQTTSGSSTERMRITSTGLVQMNGATGSFTSPSFPDGILYTYKTDNEPHIENKVNHTNSFGLYKFNNSNGAAGSISMFSTSVSYNTSSDYRLKEDVNYTWDATSKLKQLKPCEFKFKADSDDVVHQGFLAHEVDDIVPTSVFGEKDGKEMQQLDHSKLVPLLVKTIQELEARIETLEG